jgi:uncharacterized protein YqjF (DUF2071 family)
MRSEEARAQAASLAQTAHRPWPLPAGPWQQGQTWRDLLFAHWPVDPAALRPLVPGELPIDTFGGRAWLGIVPFEITGLRPRGAPPLLRFLETNVRTYTTVDERPGVYFFSLDAASPVAVAGARRLYHLPYFLARMSARRDGERIAYRSRRRGAALALDYAPDGEAFRAAPGSLEHFLVERYCLYVVRRGRVRRADIHHAPWDLQPATATIHANTLSPVALPDRPPLLHFSRRQDVVVWPLRPHA